jgi:hypothetical protein
MKIREFHSRFSSVDESSLLFSVLRRLSLLDVIASLSVTDKAWVEWPPMTDPGTGLGGAVSARA